jgi:phage tail sheath gpL-like
MTLASIIDTSNKVPGGYLKVSLGVGTQSAAAAALRILVLGNKTSAGSKAAASITQTLSVDDAITYFGQGSELHRMIKRLLGVFPGANLYGAVIAESGGTAASTTIVFSGGPATAAGTVEVYVCGERVVAPFASGDSVTAIGDAVALAINNAPDLPVTAANVTGTVTVTAKHKGPRGNRIRVYDAISSGSGVTHTATDAYLTSGATSDSPANALAAAAAQRWQIMVTPYDDATNVALFKAHHTTYCDPTEGKRGVYLYASADTLANTITLASGNNDARARCVWHYNSDVPPAELTASWAGVYAKGRSSDAAYNFDGISIPAAIAQRTPADQPINSELASALNNGISPIKVLGDGATCVLARAITTKCLAGSTPDYRVLDVHKVDAVDAVADQLETDFATFAANNPKLAADVAVGVMPPPGVATPSTIKDWAYGVTKRFDAEDAEGSAGAFGRYLTNVEANGANIVVEPDAIATGRANISIPCDVVELFHQGAIDVRQIG